MILRIMKICNLSHSINSKTPLYGGANDIIFSSMKDMNCGDSCNESFVEMRVHASTHVDFPLHFVKDGKSANAYGDHLIYNKIKFIEAHNDKGLININLGDFSDGDIDCVIIKVKNLDRNSADHYLNSPGLSIESANLLVNNFPNIKAVMLNTLSISSYKHRDIGKIVHKIFLEKEILIYEDLNLNDIYVDLRKSLILASFVFNDKIDGSPVKIYAIEK